MFGVTAGYAPPSAIGRALVSLLLLLGFYVLILSIAGALIAAPIALLLFAFNIRLLLFLPVCWLPAGLLLMSVFKTRRPFFAPPGVLLKKREAPALFDMIDELALQAGTPPPSEVFLDVLPNLAVTEEGSVFRTRRVMILGIPLLHILTVDELRAGIAHELGHFIGGDTRLMTFALQTHALFASVRETVTRNPFRIGTQHRAIETGFALAEALGHVIVRGYSRLYLRITRPISRRQELAADALSAALVGAPALASALEKIAISAPLYGLYLRDEVGVAVKHGAMPTDVAAGFAQLRGRLLESERGQRFANEVRTEVTDPYDTHPALPDRLAALQKHPPSSKPLDTRPASVILSEPALFDAAFVEATRAHVIQMLISSGSKVGALQELAWKEIARVVFAPVAQDAARGVAERLHPLIPTATSLGSMFAAVWRRVDSGNAPELLLRLEPALAHAPAAQIPALFAQVCREVLSTLLQGALLERGATVEDSLGEPVLILSLEGERVDTAATLGLLATDVDAGRAALDKWAERLDGV